MRKLASLQIIKDLIPIKGADRIELAIVQGWQVVVQKGVHRINDLIVFYEIDSWLPASDKRYHSFSDRFTTWGNERGMRLKTIKLRGQLSQGLIMPITQFEEIQTIVDGIIVEGTDLTELLGIKKWEVLEKQDNQIKQGGIFPKFIRKTDQERIQNCGHLALNCLDEDFEVTIKKDGSSATIFMLKPDSKFYDSLIKSKIAKGKWWDILFAKIINLFYKKPKPNFFGICSRNFLLKNTGTSNFHKAEKKYKLFEKLQNIDRNIALQGEIVAPDIQSNYEQVVDVEFHLFDIFDIDSQQYLTPKDRQELAQKFQLPHVTILRHGKLKDLLNSASELSFNDNNIVGKILESAEGEGDNKKVKREGLVFKHCENKFSFKAISNSYLLKKG